MRTVVELGPDVHRLLKAYSPGPSQQRYVDELLAAAGRVVAPVRAEVATDLVEPLSEREVTVLRYLCSRLTYQEIAGALYVSPNTLKSHVRSVYRKLGVASRADAIAAGRRHALVLTGGRYSDTLIGNVATQTAAPTNTAQPTPRSTWRNPWLRSFVLMPPKNRATAKRTTPRT